MNWLLLLALLPVSARAQPGMWALEKAIALKYPVPQVSGDSLAARLALGDSTLLVFDTRPLEEYDVSRLRDAIRVDPDLDSEEFIAAHGQGLLGRDLIFYCSVGYRSSDVVSTRDERGPRDGSAFGFQPARRTFSLV